MADERVIQFPFTERIWKKIFKEVKSPKDIQNVCTASPYFNELMKEIGYKVKALFGMIFPFIRPKLGPELNLLKREFATTAPHLFIERAANFKENLDEGNFGNLRKACTYWRKIIWRDAKKRLKMKYKMFPYPPDFPTTPGASRYLILSPMIEGLFGPIPPRQTNEEAWTVARRLLNEAKWGNESVSETGFYLSSFSPEVPSEFLNDPSMMRDLQEQIAQLGITTSCLVFKSQ